VFESDMMGFCFADGPVRSMLFDRVTSTLLGMLRSRYSFFNSRLVVSLLRLYPAMPMNSWLASLL